jgi:hypothetical protein
MRRLPILPHERQLEQHPEAEYVVLPQSENRQESHLSDYFGILEAVWKQNLYKRRS